MNQGRWLVIGLICAGSGVAAADKMPAAKKTPQPEADPLDDGSTKSKSVRAYEEDRPADAPADARIVSRASAETSADSFCKHNLDFAKKADPKTKNTCGPYAKAPVAKLAGKWNGASVVSLDEHSTGYVLLSHYIELVAAHDGKWIHHRLGHLSEASYPNGTHSYEVTKMYVKDVIKGGVPELVIESVEKQTRVGGNPGNETHEYLDVCSVGTSGLPSCQRVTIAETNVSDDNPEWSYKYRLAWSYDAKGRLVLKAKGAWPKNLEKRDYVKTVLYWYR
jgi:hypothetical protein